MYGSGDRYDDSIPIKRKEKGGMHSKFQSGTRRYTGYVSMPETPPKTFSPINTQRLIIHVNMFQHSFSVAEA